MTSTVNVEQDIELSFKDQLMIEIAYCRHVELPVSEEAERIIAAITTYRERLSGGVDRFSIEHGMIHDRMTGRHVTTAPDDETWNGGTISNCLTLLNSLAAASQPSDFLAKSARKSPPGEGLREAIARIIYESNPVMDQSVDLDGRPISAPFVVPWKAILETEDGLMDNCYEAADAILAALSNGSIAATIEESSTVRSVAAPPGEDLREAIALAICNEQRRFYGLPKFAKLTDMEPYHYRDQLRYADAILALNPRPADDKWLPIPIDKANLHYISAYGGRCRDCADQAGFCPQTGIGCGEAYKAITHVLEAVNYGMKHGFLPSPPAEQGEVG